MSKLSAAGLAVVGLLTPVGTHALGVGEIKLQSYLNQNLRAEIPLVLSQEKLGDIKISLAPLQDFEAAGLERSSVLSKLRFDVQPNSNGQFSIRVRSSEIIREPFLSFLLELTWPQGRMVRSFTVLLDPPQVTAAQNFPPVSAEVGPASAKPGQPAARRIAAPIDGEANLGQGEYGPVGRNEKLWAIAEKINHDSAITTEQMVIALFRFNPHAFSRPSVNALNAGAVLRIPPRDYIAAISPSVAREEFYRHQTGRSLRWRKESPPSSRPAPIPEPAATPLPDAANPTPPAVRVEPYVRNDAGMQGMEALRRENEEMRARLAELEKRVSELQALFAARETASATGPLSEMRERNPESASVLHTERSLEAPAPSTPEAGSPPASGGLSDTPNTAPATILPQAVVRAETLAEPGDSQSGNPSRDLGAVATPAAGTATSPSRLNPTAVQDRPSRIVWWLLAGVAATLSGLASLHLYRIRKRAHVSDEAVEPAAIRPVVEAPQPSAEAIAESPTAPLKVESEEVDPIFEAEIYVSYGKYDQARETVEHAIRKHPDREGYRLKLLEIYAAQGDRRSFESTLHKLEEAAESAAGPFWDRVRELEQRFAASPLASTPQPGEDVADAHAAPKDWIEDDTDRLIDELQRFSLEARNKSKQGSPDKATESKPDLQKPTVRKTPNPTSHEIAWVPVDAGQPPATPEANPDQTTVSSGDRDRSIPFAPASILEPPQPSTEAESANQSIETLLKELAAIHYERHLQADAAGAPPSSSPSDRSPGELHSMSLPESSRSSGNPAGPSNAPPSKESGFDNADDIETKLDLARAYADMGDYAQAKDFLRDVMEQGSAHQQEKAAELLATFADT